MNQHRELEFKLAADGVKAPDVESALRLPRSTKNRVFPNDRWELKRTREVEGKDHFYRIGTGKLRYRDDLVTYDSLPGNTYHYHQGCLTVKKRISEDSIVLRQEVDLLVDGQKNESIEAMAKLLGGEHSFTIQKSYMVWNLENTEGIEVCIALYTVSRLDGSEKRTFLEVEVEKDSSCSEDEGQEVLAGWLEFFKEELCLGNPLNESLQEMYGPPEPKSYLPGYGC